jgi:cytochrome c oxidase subunit III
MRASRLHEQFEDLDKQAHAARLGMWAFLGSELLLFAGLFALYAGYRAMYPGEFAVAVGHDNALLGTTNTVVLITSSFTVAMSLHAVRRGHLRRASALLAFSVACGLLFLVLKGIEYGQHLHEGIAPGAMYHYAALPTPGARLFFTLYYLMTGLHGIHVIVGMGLLTWLAVGCVRRVYSPARSIHVELGALYWHLVDVIWIFLWPMLYLMHR